MKKTLTPLLIAAAVVLSACGQDLSGGDWRTTGVVQAAGTISRSGADTDVLVCVHEETLCFTATARTRSCSTGGVSHGRAGPWDTFAAIDFADRNGDGDGDVAMTFTDSEGETCGWCGSGTRTPGVRVPAGGIRLHRDGGVAALGGSDGGLHHLAGEDGGMLALRADEALYTYRTWYGRTGQGICGTSGIGRCCCGTVTVRTCWPAAAEALPCAAWRAAWGSWTA